MATRTRLVTLASVQSLFAGLSTSNPGRLLSIGNDWTKIRIAVRAYLDHAVTFSGTPAFVMGVCSGDTDADRWNNGAASTTHFLGAGSSDSGYAFVTDGFYVNTGRSLSPIKRIATTTTYGASIAGMFVPGSNGNRRGAIFVDITKGSPNFTLNVFTPGAAAADVTKAVFDTQVLAPTPVIAGHAMGSGQTIAAAETDGVLNAVCFGWDQVPEFRLDDVAIIRLA